MGYGGMGLLELQGLMGLLELQDLLLRITERRVYNEPARVMLQVKSAPRVPQQVEKAGMVRIVRQGYFGVKVTQTGAALDLLLAPTNGEENRELE